MALPLKTGADLYNQQLIRARLQNLGAQPNTADVGLGQVYFNTGTNTAASLRIGYCYETGSVPKFHHVANLEDVNRLEELISALSGSSSESVASVLGRVITLEGYFSNGKAKDADLLDGHNSDYFATATSLGELLEDYEAFKAVFSDNSDEYINTWSEVKAFLDGIKNTEDLNAILLGINTELGKKADKATTLAGYGITDGIKYVNGIDLANGVPHNEAGYGYNQYGWKANGPALSIGTDGYLMLLQVSTSDGQLYRRYIGGDYKGTWYKILDDNNYASVLDTRYLQLTGGELSGGLTIKNNSGLYFKDTLGKAILALYVNSANKLILGAGANAEGYSTYIEGKNVYVNNNIALHGGNYSDLITTLNGNLSVGGNISLQNTGQLRYDNKEVIQYVASNNSLYIGYGTAGSSEAWNTSVWGNNIKLINKSGATLLHAKDSNDVTIGYLDALSILSNQDVHIKGNLIVDGEVSSGGIGSEGSGGASGIIILEDWEKYDDTLAQVLGAGLGVGLRDKIAALESKATNVSVAQTLTSGKEIGAITIDGVATKLFAPDDYLPLSGGTITGGVGALEVKRNFTDGGSYIRFSNTARMLGYIGVNSSMMPAFTQDGSVYYALLHEGNYGIVLDNAYLKLTGGMINTGDIAGLTIYRNNSKYSMIHFCNNEGNGLVDVGYLGVVGEGVPVYLNSSGSQFNLLHSGNFNSYAPTLTGTGASGTWGIDISGSAAKLGGRSASRFVQNNLLVGAIDANNTGGTTTAFYEEYRWSNTPISTIGTLLETFYSEGWKSQFFIPIRREENKIYFRHYSSTSEDSKWSDWKTIAFTDSNVASATKLQTARSLWGNPFDGTADVNTHLTFNANDAALAAWTKDGSRVSLFLQVNPDRHVLIGQGTARENGGLYLYGNDILMCYGNAGSSNNIAMHINSSGNVRIGTADFAMPNHKLVIIGQTITDIARTRELRLGITNHSFAENNWYYAKIGYTYEGTSEGYQNPAMTFSTMNGSYAEGTEVERMRIASNGNVGIGTTSPKAKLHVNGDTQVNGKLLGYYNNEFTYGLFANGPKSVYLQGANRGTLSICGTNASELDSVVLKSTYVRPNDTDISTLGTNAARWLNVFSVYGNISSRLLVGGATDDGSTALQVNGDIALRRGVSSAIGAPYDTNNPTVYNRIIFDGATYGIRYYSGGWTSSVVDSHTFYVGLNNDAALIIKNNKDVHISGNLIVDGQVSSGGVATEGTGGATGGSGLDRVVFTIPAQTTSFTCEHNLGTREISVTIYEEGNDYQQVLTDVYLDSTNVARIVFGSATDVAHKVVIIG